MSNILSEIKLYPSTKIPQDYHLCDGSSLLIEDYKALYDLIGDQYGESGEYFSLPNLESSNGINYIICIKGEYRL